jgi:hypothetical protein
MAGGTAAERPLRRRVSGWRRGIELVGHLADDPPGELMAMLWGPRFDREQAMALLVRWPRAATTALHVMQQSADRWDALPAARQARLRRCLMDNVACPASS